jgi:hypothetical protein
MSLTGVPSGQVAVMAKTTTTYLRMAQDPESGCDPAHVPGRRRFQTYLKTMHTPLARGANRVINVVGLYRANY